MRTERPKIIVALTAIALVLVASSLVLQSPSQAAENPRRVGVIIGFNEPPGLQEQALVRSHGGDIKYTYHLVPAIAANVPEQAMEALKHSPRVANVDLDGQVYAVGSELDGSWGVKRIGAGTVHEEGNKGTGVKIAIIDSGVDYNHPDLDDNYIGGVDFVESDDDPMDRYGHGTHVAGTACAEDNGFGVVGVAPECALYSLRVLDENGAGYFSDIAFAMQWAVDNEMQIANLSLGSSRDPGPTIKAFFDSAEVAGLIIVAAAGNDGNPPGKGNNVIYPARYGSVIAVVATNSNDGRASFSSTGDQVELAAPGVSVYSTWTEGSYKFGSGTSMASPHVAGTAALAIAAGITDVRTQLQTTADDLGPFGRDPKYGFGLVNAAKAVGEEIPSPEPPPPSEGFTLTTMGYKVRGLQKADLEWAGTTSDYIDVKRDGKIIDKAVPNTESYTDEINKRGGGSYTYQVCEAGSETICSNESIVNF